MKNRLLDGVDFGVDAKVVATFLSPSTYFQLQMEPKR